MLKRVSVHLPLFGELVWGDIFPSARRDGAAALQPRSAVSIFQRAFQKDFLINSELPAADAGDVLWLAAQLVSVGSQCSLLRAVQYKRTLASFSQYACKQCLACILLTSHASFHWHITYSAPVACIFSF